MPLKDSPEGHHLTFCVDEPTGIRLDAFLRNVTGRGLRYVRSLIERGQVRVDGHVIRKKGRSLEKGCVVEVCLDSEGFRSHPPAIPLETLSGKWGIEGVYKPPFCHTERGRHSPSIQQHLERRVGGMPYLLNRLDFLTSGIILFSREKEGVEKYRRLQEEGGVQKHYLCLVEGRVSRGRWIKNPIDHRKRRRVRVLPGEDGDRRRWSRIIPLRYFPEAGASLLEVVIFKGRRHQIRAHLAHISHPVVGDPLYGEAREARRLYLCHYLVRFPDFSLGPVREVDEWRRRIERGEL